jgi:LuxR family maltose regulon positive regulatory protein
VRLADLGGSARLLSDTHPLAVRLWGQQASSPSLLRATHASTHVEPGAPADASGRSDDPRGQLLTPKETQVLNLLSAGRPNKLIARTLAISDETVKWHMKNLFFKLSAGSRSHAVDRARLLGLLDA